MRWWSTDGNGPRGRTRSPCCLRRRSHRTTNPAATVTGRRRAAPPHSASGSAPRTPPRSPSTLLPTLPLVRRCPPTSPRPRPLVRRAPRGKSGDAAARGAGPSTPSAAAVRPRPTTMRTAARQRARKVFFPMYSKAGGGRCTDMFRSSYTTMYSGLHGHHVLSPATRATTRGAAQCTRQFPGSPPASSRTRQSRRLRWRSRAGTGAVRPRRPVAAIRDLLRQRGVQQGSSQASAGRHVPAALGAPASEWRP